MCRSHTHPPLPAPSAQFLPVGYTADTAEQGKAAAREELRRRTGLTSWGDKPLVAVVSRLTKQKGARCTCGVRVLARVHGCGGSPGRGMIGKTPACARKAPANSAPDLLRRHAPDCARRVAHARPRRPVHFAG